MNVEEWEKVIPKIIAATKEGTLKWNPADAMDSFVAGRSKGTLVIRGYKGCQDYPILEVRDVYGEVVEETGIPETDNLYNTVKILLRDNTAQVLEIIGDL